jgi:hypothetical protein
MSPRQQSTSISTEQISPANQQHGFANLTPLPSGFAISILFTAVQLSGLRWVWVSGGDFMSWDKTALSALFAGIILSAALAGNATAQVPIRIRPSTAPGTTKRPRLEPCWEVAGVSKSAIQQRRAVAQQARQQVEAVCANSSLSLQQKRQQIQRIHQQERQQIEAIITPAQQAAIRSCQEGRNGGHSGGEHVGGGHGGPCGEMSVPHNSVPLHSSNPQDDEAPPNGTAKPN